jgi:hypothetical protein
MTIQFRRIAEYANYLREFLEAPRGRKKIGRRLQRSQKYQVTDFMRRRNMEEDIAIWKWMNDSYLYWY